MSSFSFGRVASGVAVTAAGPPRAQELIAKVVGVSRGDDYVEEGQISSYTCTKRGDVRILHWTK